MSHKLSNEVYFDSTLNVRAAKVSQQSLLKFNLNRRTHVFTAILMAACPSDCNILFIDFLAIEDFSQVESPNIRTMLKKKKNWDTDSTDSHGTPLPVAKKLKTENAPFNINWNLNSSQMSSDLKMEQWLKENVYNIIPVQPPFHPIAGQKGQFDIHEINFHCVDCKASCVCCVWTAF